MKGSRHSCGANLLTAWVSLCTGISLGEFYTDPEKSLEAQIWTAQMYGNDENLKFGFASSVAWDFGGDIKMPSAEFDQTPMVVRYPVQTEEDGWKFEIADKKSLLPVF